jgi:hypothetical protein
MPKRVNVLLCLDAWLCCDLLDHAIRNFGYTEMGSKNYASPVVCILQKLSDDFAASLLAIDSCEEDARVPIESFRIWLFIHGPI